MNPQDIGTGFEKLTNEWLKNMANIVADWCENRGDLLGDYEDWEECAEEFVFNHDTSELFNIMRSVDRESGFTYQDSTDFFLEEVCDEVSKSIRRYPDDPHKESLLDYIEDAMRNLASEIGSRKVFDRYIR